MKSVVSKILKPINSKISKPRKPTNHTLFEGEKDRHDGEGHLLALEMLEEKFFATPDENIYRAVRRNEKVVRPLF